MTSLRPLVDADCAGAPNALVRLTNQVLRDGTAASTSRIGVPQGSSSDQFTAEFLASRPRAAPATFNMRQLMRQINAGPPATVKSNKTVALARANDWQQEFTKAHEPMMHDASRWASEFAQSDAVQQHNAALMSGEWAARPVTDVVPE